MRTHYYFSKTLAKRSITLRDIRWPLTPHVDVVCATLPYTRIIVSNSHVNTSKYVDTVTIFQKLNQKVNDPKMISDPTFCWGNMCDSTRGSLYPSPTKIHQSMWIAVTIFHKLLTKRSMTQMTPRWTLTPLLLRSHVGLYPRNIASNSHKKTSKHVNTVTLSSKTLTKGQ